MEIATIITLLNRSGRATSQHWSPQVSLASAAVRITANGSLEGWQRKAILPLRAGSDRTSSTQRKMSEKGDGG